MYDLAAGSGICGIAASLCGARSVIAAEIDPLAIAACTLNGAANDVQLLPTLGDPLGEPAPRVDIILVGDIFYSRSLTERALPWLRAAGRRGTCVLLGDPGRTHTPSEGLHVVTEYTVTGNAPVEDVDIKVARVLTLG